MWAARGPAPQPAIRALVQAFAQHPIVAIAEAHGLRQAGAFYIALVRDTAFERAVDDIVVEFASAQSQPLLDRYIVADVNRSLPPEHRLRVLAGDTPVDWRLLRRRADWTAFGGNDVSFARAIDGILRSGHKALVVRGSNHLMHGRSPRDGSPSVTSLADAVLSLGPPRVLQHEERPSAHDDRACLAELTRRAWLEWGDSARCARRPGERSRSTWSGAPEDWRPAPVPATVRGNGRGSVRITLGAHYEPRTERPAATNGHFPQEGASTWKGVRALRAGG